jgi:hypothetical protein
MAVIMDKLFMKKTQKIDIANVDLKNDEKNKVICPKCKRWGGNFYEDYALTIITENIKCPFCKKVIIEKTKFYEK